MSSTPTPQPEAPSVQLAPGVALALPSVKVDEIVPELAKVVVFLGAVHWAIFGIHLVITSGNDGTHAPGSKHFQNRAVDIRSRDLSPDAEIVFAAVLAFAVQPLHFSCFDERSDEAGPHWHIEV